MNTYKPGSDNNVVIYDYASNHFEGQWPEGLSHTQAYVHTGLYLSWVVMENLLSEEFLNSHVREIELLRQRKVTGPKLFESIDGKFTSTMLNQKGNDFTAYYFDLEKGSYMHDYEFALARYVENPYCVEDSWENFDKIALSIQQRYRAWLDVDIN